MRCHPGLFVVHPRRYHFLLNKGDNVAYFCPLRGSLRGHGGSRGPGGSEEPATHTFPSWHVDYLRSHWRAIIKRCLVLFKSSQKSHQRTIRPGAITQLAVIPTSLPYFICRDVIWTRSGRCWRLGCRAML
ncbi:hypothetical protein TcCL_Unassigned00990 [Trypanosoma cruzi]|nr:hypothetical protein TcCL_Unassigned00990 [Trypanosoma cruzi]